MRIITDPTSISGVALEVRSLCVHLVIWAANPYPLNAYMHCAHSQCLETQNPEALSPTTYWDTGLRSIDAKLPMKPLKVTAPHTKTNDRLVVANPSFHSFFANNILLCTTQMQCKTLQTHILPPRCSLFLLHAHKSKAQTPRILITPP
jgi:hypothetical protein